jgi:macrolide-specific efflux system membrane fusion protein
VSVVRRYLTKPWVALPLVAVVVVAGWSVLKPDKSSSTTVTVPTEQVVAATTGTVARTVSTEGTIAYAQTKDLNFAASGTVTAVDVVAGQKVTAGQVLAVLSSPELSAAVDDDEASLASAQATLSDHQAAGASAAQLNADRTAVSSAESRLASAQAALAAANLVAPFDGTVAQVNVTTGEQLGSNGAGGTSTSGTGSGSGRSSATLGSGTSNAQSSGSQGSSSTPDVQVVTDGQYTVSLGIDDTEVANVAVGQSASLTLSTSTTATNGFRALAGLFGGGGAGGGGAARQATTGSAATPTGLGVAPATGQVTTVSTVADASSGVAKYPVTVTFTDDTGKYHAGATVSVAITYAEVQNAVQVPSLAVTTTDGASTVKVRTASGDETRTVTTGLTSGNLVQITSGLKAGEQVVVTFAFRGGGAGGGTRGTGGTGTGGTGQLRLPGGTP